MDKAERRLIDNINKAFCGLKGSQTYKLPNKRLKAHSAAETAKTGILWQGERHTEQQQRQLGIALIDSCVLIGTGLS